MQFQGYDIQVTVRKNCRRMILRCRDGQLYLSLPPRTAKKTVETFLWAHTDWMRDVLARHPKQTQANDPARLQALVRELLPRWEARMGVKATVIRYREMVSRWGSCQPKTGKITLNLRLSVKSERCIEYVLVHELCHLLHPDHSPAFHSAMTALMPDWRERKRELNGMSGGSIP